MSVDDGRQRKSQKSSKQQATYKVQTSEHSNVTTHKQRSSSIE